MLQLQEQLQTDTYGYNFQRMLPADRIQYIKDMKLALDAELQEALDEVSWKPWATSHHINREAYISELVDAFHFLMNMLLVFGDSPDVIVSEFFTRYCLKNRVNAQRQEDGYDGVSTKCPICKRALDDSAVTCNTVKVDNCPEPVLSGYCSEKNSHYYWINTVGDTGRVDKPMTILWPLCGGCGRGIQSWNRYPDGLRCTKNGDQGFCGVKNADVNYIGGAASGPSVILTPIKPPRDTVTP